VRIKALKAAFPKTIPVLLGYVFLGIAFGVLLSEKQFSIIWALIMSLTIFAGSMQFVAIGLLTIAFNPIQTLIMTLLVNARHIFYGFSMLEPYADTGKFKPYLIFALSDETYSLLCSGEAPEGVDKKWYFFWVSALDQCYWVVGSLIGAIAGNFLPFDSTGIDFTMTALFLVIFTEQWEKAKSKIPALAGLAVTVACRLVFGIDNFLIFSMLGIVLALIIFKRQIEKAESFGTSEAE